MFGIYEKPVLHAEDALMQGETDVVFWPLNQMRRQQLHDLARAYDVPVELGGASSVILPDMLSAQKSGVFNARPKHPEYARKAMRNSDQPGDDQGRGNSFSA